MDYMTLKEASEKWGVSIRQINYYCAGGRIPGAVKVATIYTTFSNAFTAAAFRQMCMG